MCLLSILKEPSSNTLLPRGLFIMPINFSFQNLFLDFNLLLGTEEFASRISREDQDSSEAFFYRFLLLDDMKQRKKVVF